MPEEVCLQGMFRAQARKTPDNVAILGADGKTITYSELDSASDKLAAMLLNHGVKKDSCVGILMERCNEYALAYVSILKAGGCYLPLDVNYPDQMLADVLVDSTPEVVICNRTFVAKVPKSQTVILLDSLWDGCLSPMTPQDEEKLQQVDNSDLDSLAYIVYTSGTTGRPKGIAAPHRGAVFSYNWRFENIPYEENEIEGCNVFFVWEMMRPLLKGQTLCVVPDDVIYDPPTLSEYIGRHCVTRMLFTPSLLEAVLDCKSIPIEQIANRLQSLRVILLCGEVVTVSLQERIKKYLPKAQLWNLYSISECHDVACLDLTNGNYGTRKYCPVGHLFDGVEAYVFDESMIEKPIGDAGELYVAGPTLARCYVGLEQLTKERFPIYNGKRMYKTGDTCRVLPNRELEILGRCDSMVKIRGYSVQLRAIEATIMELGMVSSCCVVAQGEEGTDKFVIAYVVLKGDATCRKVRMELKAKLPHYMVPSFICDLDELPTHEVSGKLNKKALPALNLETGDFGGRARTLSTQETDCIAPRNELERNLHDVWCKVMNMQNIDVVYDSFFDIGGHSLLAAKLVQAIKVDLGYNVGVVNLFAHSTIQALADYIEKGDDGIEPQESVDLNNEVEVFDVSKAVNDITMRAFWRSTKFSQIKARSVLITGCTGFLGSYLLYELLQNEEIDVVYCIVRPSSDDSVTVMDRVRDALSQAGLWRDQYESRLEALGGDTSLHHLGLDDDDYAALSTAVDIVVHCAALVNLVYPYEGLRSANVLGTRNMIEFALLGKVKKFCYISTNGVFPDGLESCLEDADLDEFSGKLTNGYSQSKWVAEKLVLEAKKKGLPTVIFRPGNMGGDSGSRGGGKAWNTSDFNYLMLTGCIHMGAAPVVDGWLMEMTPVDVAAHGIVDIFLSKDALGDIYHVTNSQNCLTSAEYFDSIRNAGYHLQNLEFDEWKAKLEESNSPSLVKVKNACVGTTASFLKNLSTFDNQKFAAKCQDHGIYLPNVTTTMIHEYVEGWQRNGVIPNPVAPGRPLLGKVVAITGASSGIGNGIAKVLSEAGASIGLGSRRLEKLQIVAEELSTKTTCFKVDVTKREEMKAFIDHVEEQLGPIDIFVNNAGVMYYQKLKNLDEQTWEQQVDVNCKGLLHGVGAVLPKMLSRGKGEIVVISSDAGRKVFPGLSVYSASKFFVEAFCQGLRLETAETGLKVTTIQPGDCKTEISNSNRDDEARQEYAQPSDSREYWLDPEDVARAVLFALSAPNHVGINEILVEPRGAPA